MSISERKWCYQRLAQQKEKEAKEYEEAMQGKGNTNKQSAPMQGSPRDLGKRFRMPGGSTTPQNPYMPAQMPPEMANLPKFKAPGIPPQLRRH